MNGREGESFMHHRSSIRRNKLLRCQSSIKSNQKDSTITWEYSGKYIENDRLKFCGMKKSEAALQWGKRQ